MIDGWTIVAVAIAYIALLFAIAYAGDRASARSPHRTAPRPMTYALSLAVYCTSWTFFGSVGIASHSGVDFLPVYVGPILVFIIGGPLLMRIAELSKSQNITSIADFIAARYGKSQVLATLAALIAVAGTIPYIALQLKAISLSVATMLPATPTDLIPQAGPAGQVAFLVALSLAVFAVLFGTRHIDATEHQEGLVMAIAAESVVKLVAFLVVGIFVTFFLFDGPAHLWQSAQASPEVQRAFDNGFQVSNWLAITFLSTVCIILLPRQFHVTVVEYRDKKEIDRARWLFPAYLVLINAFVIPIAVAGLLVFSGRNVDADTFVLAIPLDAGAKWIAMTAFIGGLSAATAMVIIASVALAIMICNDVVVPLLLRRNALADPSRDNVDDIGPLLLNIRRISILCVLVLAYGFHHTVSSDRALASIGLLSFAAIAQLAPAFFGGIFWNRATAKGAIAGIVVGFAVWSYTLLLPWVANAGWAPVTLVDYGPYGITWLKPQAFFGLELGAVPHGVLFSILANVTCLVLVSLATRQDPIERMQARIFVGNDSPAIQGPAIRLWRSSITVDDLMRTVARYVGTERAERSFTDHAASRAIVPDRAAEADLQYLRFSEHLLASAIGAASSRLVLTLLLKRNQLGARSAIRLLDDASEALQYNRDLLQSALDQVGQGISVFDRDMRLICWNRQFRALLNLPPEAGRVGIPLDDILRTIAANGDFGPGPIEDIVRDRLARMVIKTETFQERMAKGNRVLEVRTSAMPQGGVVITFTDITERVEAADALRQVNESLERRVQDRTAELTKVNRELSEAKAKADEANLDKTRFLAAASHDLLQPLNAARLYTTSLVEKSSGSEFTNLVRNVDTSLDAVEEILGTLLDISRLDTGALEPDFTHFPLHELLSRLNVEFAPFAFEKSLRLTVVPSGLWVRSDRKLLRRVLQNLVSNAIKYTPSGRVLVGCRRRGENVELQVFDTGPGISPDQQESVFKEFHRLTTAPGDIRGLGLGLSIVQRIGRRLDHPIRLRSRERSGTMFSITLPITEPREKPVAAGAAALAPGRIDALRVYCVDNEPDILASMRLLLENWGCRVTTAASLTEAEAHLEEQNEAPDVLLADYHLDNETGLDLVDAMRRRIGETFPAAIITADRSAEIEREIRKRRLVLLRKPVKPAALRSFLTQITHTRRPAEAVPQAAAE